LGVNEEMFDEFLNNKFLIFIDFLLTHLKPYAIIRITAYDCIKNN